MQLSPLRLASLTLLLALGTPALAQEPAISPEGRFLIREDRQISPQGSMRLLANPVGGDVHEMRFDVLVEIEGRRLRLPELAASAFLATDAGKLVAIDAHESNTYPTRVQLIDPRTASTQEILVPALRDPQLSPDGRWLAFGFADGIGRIDLMTGERSALPHLDRFAVGPGGQVAGTDSGRFVHDDGQSTSTSMPLPIAVRELLFDDQGQGVWIATAHQLLRYEASTASIARSLSIPAGAELRDLDLAQGQLHLGLGHRRGRTRSGWSIAVGPGGNLTITTGGAVSVPTGQPIGPSTPGLAWPLGPGTQRPVGNTYGEYQRYGGSPYMHPGVDVLGADAEPLFAVKGGEVKALLTTSGQYHWRLAISELGGSGTTTGYLYAHVDLPSVAVDVGDIVQPGDYLGDLVPWPVAGFTHCHFARIEDTGAQWFGDWLCTDNPHPEFSGQTESQAPVFENAIGNDLFAFCTNDTSNYQDPDSLTGEVDIIAHVGDEIASTWVCTVQELRYSIWPAGMPGSPVVDDKLAVAFEMALDTYQNGPIDPFLVDLLYKQDSTCFTDGDYGDREFFHILTNSNGDTIYEASDVAEAWDTSALPDGDYVIEVTAIDAAGNATTASMTVTTDN